METSSIFILKNLKKGRQIGSKKSSF